MPLFQVVRRSHVDAQDDLSVFFVERYSDLRQWAMQITEGDVAAAEDLVQEAYVSVAQSPRERQISDNLDGYFYCVLRNLHISDMRRGWKRRYQDLSVLDFDSLYLQLQFARSFDTVELQNQLSRLCEYLCDRKEQSSAICVFLLRFFRGYLPEEIMLIGRIARAAVDKKMRIARLSARQYLKKRPDSPDVRRRAAIVPQEPRYVLEAKGFLKSIRNTLRLSDKGFCLTDREIDGFYGSERTGKPSTQHLAHLVSCEPCLERISSALSVPPPSARSPFDGPDPTREDAATKLRRAQQLLRETLAHQPSTLTLAVNGEVILSFDVASANLRQSVTLPASTTIQFVEVFGDAGLRLLTIHVEQAPPFGPPEIVEVLRLNSQRTLSVSIAWLGLEPKVHISYDLPGVEPVHPRQAQGDALEEPEVIPISSGAPTKELSAAGPSRWQRLVRWLFSRHRLLPVIAMAVSVCGAFVLWHHYHSAPPRVPSASTLLARSNRAEAAVSASGDLVHRVIVIEELPQNGGVITQQRVEVWRQGRQTARRLYDTGGHLLAGEWEDAEGQRLVLRNGRRETAPSDTASCESMKSSWMCDLSAATVERRFEDTADWQVRQTASDYVISVAERAARFGTPAAPHVVRATLVVDRDMMRAKEQDLWVNDGGSTRHLRYIEVSYLRSPHIDPRSSLFRPDEGVAPRLRRNSVLMLRNREDGTSLVHLQIQVLKRLHSIGADVGEPIDITADPIRGVTISGVLPEAQARAIREALVGIARDPSLHINIYSTAEAARMHRRIRRPPQSIDQIEIDASRSPSEAVLRDHFSKLGYSGAQLDEQVYRYTQSVLGQSATALQQAWALHRLGLLATEEGSHDLSFADRQDFLALLGAQTSQLTSDLSALGASVSWLPGLGNDEDLAMPLEGTRAALPEVIDTALTSVTRINNILHARLEASASTSSTDSPDPPLSASGLQRSLLVANDALFRIEHATQQHLAQMARP